MSVQDKFVVLKQQGNLLTIRPAQQVTIKMKSGPTALVLFVVIRSDRKIAVSECAKEFKIDSDDDVGYYNMRFRRFDRRRQDGGTDSDDMDLNDPATKEYIENLKKFVSMISPLDISESQLLEIFERFSKKESYQSGDLKRICEEQGFTLKT